MKRGGSLILAVASAGQSRKVRVVDVTVGNDVQGWQCVGQDVGLAAVHFM